MSELLRLLADSLAFLLEPGRYRLIDSSSGESFRDASILLKSDAMRIELINDRSELSLRFQPTEGQPDDWFWIGVARRLMDGDRPGSDRLDDSSIDSLRRCLVQLEREFQDDSVRPKLVTELRNARDERATELFG